MKKLISLSFTILLVLMVGCSPKPAQNGFDNNKSINVVSREDGSGTRGAFIEIVKILEKDPNGNENDNTTEESIIQNGTDAIMSTISGDKYSIGYISLGSLNNTVKALNINGVEANTENIQNNSYEIARPFNIAYGEEKNPLRDDFISFILSSLGQNIVVEEGFVESINDPLEYSKAGQKGQLIVAGSTSISPIMEKLAEKYMELNKDVVIEIQSTGSSAGVQAVLEESAHIGMVSRDLKDSEKEKLEHLAIALDGIVVIVNNDNPLNDITMEEVKLVYTGNITSWDEVRE